jgi:flagellar basal-body rod protein FlgB
MDIGIMKAMHAKMTYLNERQSVLSQNIANADTPDYQARDLEKVDFGRVLRKTLDQPTIYVETTQAGHMPDPAHIKNARARELGSNYEVAPDGNQVVVEEQLIKASKTQIDYNLMTSLYQKQMGMMRTALGTNR